MLEDTKRSLIVSQDIKLVKALSGNNPKVRDRALRNLRKWFDQRSLQISFTEDEFIRIWKGLFYAMWMSDKPLVQEDCAERIAQLVHFPDVDTSLLFFKCSLIVLATEWFGIDQLRLDKFLMFVRRVLRQALFVLKNNKWQTDSVAQFGNILYETVLQNSNCLGLTMHVIEIYLEELAKVSNGKTSPTLMTSFLRPFVKYLAALNDNRLIVHIKKFMFHHLLQQSNEGIEYQVKFQAWKGEGFPGGTIDAMQNVRDASEDNDEMSDSDEDTDNQPLDPRAGEVDVVLPQLKFNARQISKLLLEFKFINGSTTKSRDVISDLAKKFALLAKGKFPLGMKKIQTLEEDDYSTSIRKSVNRLVKFEKQLVGNNRKRKPNTKVDDAPVTLPKKRKIQKDNKQTNSDFFQKKLEKFIKNSEHKVKTKKKRSDKISYQIQSNSAIIERNSGPWLVEPLDTAEITHNGSVEKTNHNQSGELNINKSNLAFPQNEWDSPPKKDEVEIFVPSNKYKKKIELRGKNSAKRSSLLLKTPLANTKKPRYSLDSNLVKNPFSHKFATPISEKKVKINLKLNSSQEVYEHHAQLRRSPAIPFDATKKPVKPLLKSNVSSPINPFCRIKLLS